MSYILEQWNLILTSTKVNTKCNCIILSGRELVDMKKISKEGVHVQASLKYK